MTGKEKARARRRAALFLRTGARKHPIQHVHVDEHGIVRFRQNQIVRFLLDEGPFNLNDIALRSFDREDREQFAQLIGYSVSGAGDLDYVSRETLDLADAAVAALLKGAPSGG